MIKEMISFAELARRVSKTKAYISQLKSQGVLEDAIVGKKVDYDMALLIINSSCSDRNSRQILSKTEDKTPIKKDIPITKDIPTKKETLAKIDTSAINIKPNTPQVDKPLKLEKPQDLLKQIEKAIKDSSADPRIVLTLKLKAEALKIYFSAQTEQLKYEQSLGNLFNKDEIESIFFNIVINVRNSIANLANNYAVKLEGLDKKQIKEYVEADTNKILLDLQDSKGLLPI